MAEESSLPSPNEPLPHPNWDRYQLVGFLGAGAMGTVYKASDPRLGRSVAVKFLHLSHPETGDLRERRRFEREARAQASIEHPNICKIYEVGEINGQPFITMQLIDGQPLSSIFTELVLETRVRLVKQIAEALHAAHSQGLIHRDIKPGNIMVERRADGEWFPYLMDFGLARETDSQTSTATGTIEGTPAFMSPEQVRGAVSQLDLRTDIYSLGATLYMMLVGRPPFVGRSMDVMLDVLTRDPTSPRTLDPTLPKDLETIVKKCMERGALRRYASALALAEDLGRYLLGAPISARPPGAMYRLGKLAQRHKLLVATAGTAAAISLFLGGVALRARWQAAAEAQLAAELGQDVKEMELSLRVGYMMPLHDITPEKEVARQRMQKLAVMALTLPKERRGLVESALGRSHLALREHEAALLQLRAATQHGYRSPDVHYALGRALGAQYQELLVAVERISDSEYREKERAQLTREYLIPARENLQKARGVRLESPEYVEGLLLYYSQHYKAAAEKAEAALRSRPWQYEAHILAGDAWSAMGIAAQDRGQYEEGRKDLELAIGRYDAAADLARSDSTVYESAANAWAKMIENIVQRGGSPRTAYDSGLAACEHAIQTDPRSVAAYERKIANHERFQSYLLSRGEFSQEIADQAVNDLARLTRLQEASASAYLALGDIFVDKSYYENSHGKAPTASMQQAREYFKKAIAQNSNYASIWNGWGTLESTHAEWMLRHGSTLSELEERLAEAEKKYQRAVEIRPNNVTAHVNLIDHYARSARLAVLIGKSVAPYLRSAVATYQAGIKINPNEYLLHNNLALVELADAKFQFLSHNDPQSALTRALENTNKTLQIKPDCIESYQSRAEAHLIAALYRLRHDGDVGEALSRGLQALTDRAKHGETEARDETLRSRLLSTRARWLAKKGSPAQNDLREASAAATRALALDAEDPDAHLALAEAARYSVELGPRPSKDKTLGEQLNSGLAMAERALRQQPWNGFAQAAQASFFIMKSRYALDLSMQREWNEKGKVALLRAIEQYPHLRPDYELLAR